MQIYVYRHALANFEQDPENPPLTSEGRKQVKQVSERASFVGFDPTSIVSSPLVRARETAEIVKETLGVKKEIVVDDCLYGGKKPAEVYAFLKRFKKNERIALVSHQPLIDHLIADLIKGNGARIQMLNGSIAGIETKKPAKGSGTLLWLAPPK